MALSKKKKDHVAKLLKEGKLSKRAIHRETGVSRITIDKIEQKLLYPEKEPEPPKPKLDRDAPATFINCKSCGHRNLENTPCLRCHIYKQQINDYNTYMGALLSPGG